MSDGPASPTVLLVEHEQDCRRLWRLILDNDERFGRVSEASSCRQVFELLIRDYPDIVIIDVGTGRANLQVLEFLRSRYPMPIVVATSASTGVADSALKQGATVFLPRAELLLSDMPERVWGLWRHRSKLSTQASRATQQFAQERADHGPACG